MASSMTLPMPPRSGPDSSPLQFFHTFEEICSKSFVILRQINDWPWVSHSSWSEKIRAINEKVIKNRKIRPIARVATSQSGKSSSSTRKMRAILYLWSAGQIVLPGTCPALNEEVVGVDIIVTSTEIEFKHFEDHSTSITLQAPFTLAMSC